MLRLCGFHSVSRNAVASRFQEKSRYDPREILDPADGRLVLPKRTILATDSPAMDHILRAHNPYGYIYPSELFENGLEPLEEESIEPDVMKGTRSSC